MFYKFFNLLNSFKLYSSLYNLEEKKNVLNKLPSLENLVKTKLEKNNKISLSLLIT